MSTTSMLPRAPSQMGPSTAVFPWWALALATALGVAHLPLLAQHAQQIWLRPHYRFFPLVLLGSAVLAFLRLRDLGPLSPGRPTISLALLALSWSLLAVAE